MALQASLNGCAFDIIVKFNLGLLSSTFSTWNTAFPVTLRINNITTIKISDWLDPSLFYQKMISGTGNEQDLQNTIFIMTRILESAIFAENSGTISGAQANALDASYQTIWG